MEPQINSPIIVVIPALEPDENLLSYTKELRIHGLTELIIIDDGSGPIYQPIFESLSSSGCVVLRHTKNLGKGCALKTAFTYIQTHYPYFSAIVTADSDGQHAAADVARVAKQATAHPNALTLGVRDFNIQDVPSKSLFGNRISAFIFHALYGVRLSDTQTGLRAFGMPLLSKLLSIKGTRFEYEIEMLIACAQADIPLHTIPIQVIYENNNKNTHFKPLRDSLRIVGTMLSNFLRFSVSSLIGAAVDLIVAWVLLDLLRPFFSHTEPYQRILVASLLARIFSITVNYWLNRSFVFEKHTNSKRSLIRYLLLCVLIILLSATGVFVLSTMFGLNEKVSKPICDILLFLLSYKIQQRWVFTKKQSKSIAQRGTLNNEK